MKLLGFDDQMLTNPVASSIRWQREQNFPQDPRLGYRREVPPGSLKGPLKAF